MDILPVLKFWTKKNVLNVFTVHKMYVVNSLYQHYHYYLETHVKKINPSEWFTLYIYIYIYIYIYMYCKILYIDITILVLYRIIKCRQMSNWLLSQSYSIRGSLWAQWSSLIYIYQSMIINCNVSELDSGP